MTTTKRISCCALVLFLMYFFGYFFKFFALITYEYYFGLENYNPEFSVMTVETMAYSFLIGTIVFLPSIIVAARSKVNNSKFLYCGSFSLINFHVYLFIILTIIALYLRFDSGSFMGKETRDLPWYRGTLVYRTQSLILPGFFITLLHVLKIRGAKLEPLFLSAFFVLSVFATSYISGSKSAGGALLLLFVIYFYITNHSFERKHYILMFFAAAIAFVFYIYSAFNRVSVINYGETLSILQLYDQVNSEILLNSLVSIATRISGLDGISTLCAYDNFCNFFSGSYSYYPEQTPLQFYTYDVVGVKDNNDFRAPGFIAFFIIKYGVFFGVFISLLFLNLYIIISNRFIPKLSYGTQVVWYVSSFGILSEGLLLSTEFVALSLGLIINQMFSLPLMRVLPQSRSRPKPS